MVYETFSAEETEKLGEQIGREDIDYRVHKARRLCSFIFQCACLQDLICSLENVRENESDDYSKCCSAEVVNNSTESDGTYFLDVRERYNALNDRSNYDRNYDELEQVQEDSTKRLDISFGKTSCTCCKKDESCHDTKAESDEYLKRQ